MSLHNSHLNLRGCAKYVAIRWDILLGGDSMCIWEEATREDYQHYIRVQDATQGLTGCCSDRDGVRLDNDKGARKGLTKLHCQ
jgi:hypothetical protein